MSSHIFFPFSGEFNISAKYCTCPCNQTSRKSFKRGRKSQVCSSTFQNEIQNLSFFHILHRFLHIDHNLKSASIIPMVYYRKAVKAAIVLLPLLGLNNFLAMVQPPLDGIVKFGLVTYTSTFLISFQGFFISLLYCFLNGEVSLIV